MRSGEGPEVIVAAYPPLTTARLAKRTWRGWGRVGAGPVFHVKQHGSDVPQMPSTVSAHSAGRRGGGWSPVADSRRTDARPGDRSTRQGASDRRITVLACAQGPGLAHEVTGGIADRGRVLVGILRRPAPGGLLPPLAWVPVPEGRRGRAARTGCGSIGSDSSTCGCGALVLGLGARASTARSSRRRPEPGWRRFGRMRCSGREARKAGPESLSPRGPGTARVKGRSNGRVPRVGAGPARVRMRKTPPPSVSVSPGRSARRCSREERMPVVSGSSSPGAGPCLSGSEIGGRGQWSGSASMWRMLGFVVFHVKRSGLPEGRVPPSRR